MKSGLRQLKSLNLYCYLTLVAIQAFKSTVLAYDQWNTGFYFEREAWKLIDDAKTNEMIECVETFFLNNVA